MTEEEAKTKECPNKFLSASLCVSMTDEDKSITAEDVARILDSTKCIASDCMMWRLDEARDENMVLVPCDTGGHCGLAK